MVISDNGASAEGGPHGSINENLFFNNVPETLEDGLSAIDELGGPEYFNHYPWGWAWAGNTPFRRWKRETYRGGVSDPFIVHWPKGISRQGEIRTQYVHAIDMVPTVLDALGLEPPSQIRGVTQSPIQGVSFAHTFDDGSAESRHHTQYFEMMGHRAIYHDGWRAVCPVPGPSFNEAGMGFGEMVITEEKLRELDANGWELYHVAEDVSETKNLASENRDQLIEMIALWYAEAGKYNVLPLDSRGAERLADERPQLTEGRQRYVYPRTVGDRGHDRSVRAQSTPQHLRFGGDSTTVQRACWSPRAGTSGGYSLYVKDHRLHYAYNYLGVEHFHLSTDGALGRHHELLVQFEPTGQPDLAHGQGHAGARRALHRRRLRWTDRPAGDHPVRIGITEGLTVGRDDGSAVTSAYDTPFPFTGTLEQVVVDVSGDLIQDKHAEMRAVMAHQ